MENKPNNQPNKLVIFQSKKIRRIWNEDEWYYSVVDIIAALTDSPTPRQYWGKVKHREFVEIELSPIWVQLKLPAGVGGISMNETKTRAELIDPKLKACSWGVVENSKILPAVAPVFLIPGKSISLK
jgi:hypothetical protein